MILTETQCKKACTKLSRENPEIDPHCSNMVMDNDSNLPPGCILDNTSENKRLVWNLPGGTHIDCNTNKECICMRYGNI